MLWKTIELKNPLCYDTAKNLVKYAGCITQIVKIKRLALLGIVSLALLFLQKSLFEICS